VVSDTDPLTAPEGPSSLSASLWQGVSITDKVKSLHVCEGFYVSCQWWPETLQSCGGRIRSAIRAALSSPPGTAAAALLPSWARSQPGAWRRREPVGFFQWSWGAEPKSDNTQREGMGMAGKLPYCAVFGTIGRWKVWEIVEETEGKGKGCSCVLEVGRITAAGPCNWLADTISLWVSSFQEKKITPLLPIPQLFLPYTPPASSRSWTYSCPSQQLSLLIVGTSVEPPVWGFQNLYWPVPLCCTNLFS
jgi:hypothetical protein